MAADQRAGVGSVAFPRPLRHDLGILDVGGVQVFIFLEIAIGVVAVNVRIVPADLRRVLVSNCVWRRPRT